MSNFKAKTIDKGQCVLFFNKSIDLISLMKGYDLVADSLEIVNKEFYLEFFADYPDAEILFADINEVDRIGAMTERLKLLFENLQDEEKSQSIIKDLAKSQIKYGIDTDLYEEALGVFIGVCKKHVGRKWTKKITAAWGVLFSVTLEIVLDTYKNAQYQSEKYLQGDSEQERTAKTDDTLMLESIQDISKSELLKQEILLLIKTSKNIKIDASNVGRVDGSALQLLCGLFIYSKANNIQLSWINPSEAMIASAQYTGMQEQLDLIKSTRVKQI